MPDSNAVAEKPPFPVKRDPDFWAKFTRDVVRRYVTWKWSVKRIADHWNCKSLTPVRNALEEAGVEFRRRGRPSKKSNARAHG